MKRKLSQTISKLLHRELHFGTRRQWLIGLTLAGALCAAFTVFTPGIETAKWHFENPNTVSCPTFTAQIPPLWTASQTNPLVACRLGLTMNKLTSAFGTWPKHVALVSISPMLDPASNHGQKHTLQLLHQLYPSGMPVPYQLNSTFTHCFLTPNNISLPNGKEIKSIHVYCVDQKRKLTLTYDGPRSALPQVAAMIR